MSNPSSDWAAAAERARRPLSTRAWVALGLLPVIVVGTGVFAMVKLAAWVDSCPAAAAQRTGQADVGQAPLQSFVASTVPGHTFARGAPFDAAEFPRALSLARHGFASGFHKDFTAASGDNRVQISVLQFDSDRAARNYEADVVDDACYYGDAEEVSLPRSYGASGIATACTCDRHEHRIAILRGRRAYVATITGTEIHSDIDVLTAMASAAR